MGLIRTPDLYRCAISIGGPVDLSVLIDTVASVSHIINSTGHESIGDPVADKLLLDSVSPLIRAGEITNPVLLIQGAFDTYVHKKDTDRFFEKLAHPNSKYIIYKESHQFNDQSNLNDLYGQVFNFLRVNMPPASRAAVIANPAPGRGEIINNMNSPNNKSAGKRRNQASRALEIFTSPANDQKIDILKKSLPDPPPAAGEISGTATAQ